MQSLIAPRAIAKKAVRAVGIATSSLRPAPDFLIIGAKRGGTTSFYFDLLEHPSILRLFPPPISPWKKDATKGVHYFDSNFDQGSRWYRSYMPTSASRRVVTVRRGERAVAGEASPYYLFHPAVAARAHESVPAARIIVLLRDPVMRTYSHWKERRRGGAEALDFQAALAAEPERLDGERRRLFHDATYRSYAWEQQSYATQSLYAESLRPWIERFGRDNVHCVISEEYYEDPARVLRDVDSFLGLTSRKSARGIVRNAANGLRLDPQISARLRARFREPNLELSQLLGRSLPWE